MKFLTETLLLLLLVVSTLGNAQSIGLSTTTDSDSSPALGTEALMAVPSNDNCATPIEIFSGDVLLADNTEATGVYGHIGCTEPVNAYTDLWYAFDYDGTGRVTINLDGDDGLSVDTYLAIADSCEAGFFNCNNDANTGSNSFPFLDSQLIFECGDLAAGTYVFSAGAFDSGLFTVSLLIQTADGCTNPSACNYDPLAGCDDGSCIWGFGCTEPVACNYDPAAGCDDGTCEFTTCLGCTFPLACNFDPSASLNDGTCEYDSCAGCTYLDAAEYDPSATVDDGSCTIGGALNCPEDVNGDQQINTSDLLMLIGAFGQDCNP